MSFLSQYNVTVVSNETFLSTSRNIISYICHWISAISFSESIDCTRILVNSIKLCFVRSSTIKIQFTNYSEEYLDLYKKKSSSAVL